MNQEKGKMIAAMLIVGTIGVFVEKIALPSEVVACARSVVGTLVLLLALAVRRKKLDRAAIRRNGLPLLLSGAALGFNWILLFEAYRWTTVAVATLCYYMAPVFVILLSPLVLKERLTAARLLCVLGAVAGTALISGAGGAGNFRGPLLGLCAALLYCAIVLLNRGMREIEPTERTVCQLGVSAVVMLAYVLLRGSLSGLHPAAGQLLLLAVVGVVHTGIVYLLFFSAVGRLPAQTASLLSYLDPVTAVLLSALWLHQPLTAIQLCGAALILGCTLVPELLPERKH